MKKVLDHVYGSWFHRLDRKNTLAEGRCPDKPDLYHAVQATLIPYYAADLSIALAVKIEKFAASKHLCRAVRSHRMKARREYIWQELLNVYRHYVSKH